MQIYILNRILIPYKGPINRGKSHDSFRNFSNSPRIVASPLCALKQKAKLGILHFTNDMYDYFFIKKQILW